MTVADVHRAILAVWRIEQPRLITSLARMLRDVPLAEELTQEALLAALEQWPTTGVPEKPGAWLMTTARRRALDHLRRGPMLERKHEMLALDMEEQQQAMPDWDGTCRVRDGRGTGGQQARTGPAEAARRRGGRRSVGHHVKRISSVRR